MKLLTLNENHPKKMKKTGKLPVAVSLILILYLAVPLPFLAQTGDGAAVLPGAQIAKIEAFVQNQMTRGKIPGMSVVIVKGDQTLYEKGFGYADSGKKEPATPTTLFELGSCSKAFTGLAILQLEEKGSLALNDPVDKYIPWLKLKYGGKEVPVTIGQLLYHTSGVPYYETLGNIPPSKSDDALEEMVRTLVGFELSRSPGRQFSYSTTNYDVLGLVIQKISDRSFEEYIKENILMPLQLNNTFLSREEAEAKGMATGYKICFKKPYAYEAPMYRGNTPAAYIISNVRDMARWLKIQMGAVELTDTGISKELIGKSHASDPDLTTSNYAAGWFKLPNYRLITHSGGNPNFSSFIAFSEGKVGVVVLANISSGFTTGTGQGILTILAGMDAKPTRGDMNLHLDNMFLKFFLGLSILLLLALVLFIRILIQIAAKKRRFSARGTKRVVGASAATVLLIAFCYLISIIPTLLGFKMPLSPARVWGPGSFTYTLLWLFLTGFLFYLFFLSALFFPKKKSVGG